MPGPVAKALPAHIVSSHKTQLLFGALELHCTNVDEATSSSAPSSTENTIDVSTLDIDNGGEKIYAQAPLTEPSVAVAGTETTLSVSFLGPTAPVAGEAKVITINSVNRGTWKCTRANLTKAVNEYVAGTAEFTLVTAPTP